MSATRAMAAMALLLASAGVLAAEPKLPELNLKYAVTWRGMGLGSATITLKQSEGPDCYRYESVTDPVGLVRMFYGKPRETSDFCVRSGRVVPRRFEFEDPKGDDSFTLEFEAGKVRTKKEVREIPANAQDRFGIQQAVRLWVLENLNSEPGAVTAEYAMVDDHRIRTYRFAITGREPVEVPAGRFDAVLVQRVDDKKKTIKFWLAQGRDYMPVKVEQVRQGKTELRLELR